VIAALVLLAGCGGGSSSSRSASTGGGARLTYAEWVAAADAVCSKGDKANAKQEAEFDALLEQGLTSPSRRAKAADLIRAAIPDLEGEATAFAGLVPPASAKVSSGAIVKELEEAAELDDLFAEALESGSAHELEVRSQALHLNGDELQALATDVGLKVCGQPPDAG